MGTPEQNGRVERKHQHILNVARALRFQSHLPIFFWGECVLVAAHLINHTPSLLLHGKSPFECLFGRPPSYDALRVIGCLAYAHNQKTNGDKFASRSRKCIFIGYPFGQKGWKLYDLERKVFFMSRDVKFVDHIFPFLTPTKVDVSPDLLVSSSQDIHWDFDDYPLPSSSFPVPHQPTNLSSSSRPTAVSSPAPQNDASTSLPPHNSSTAFGPDAASPPSHKTGPSSFPSNPALDSHESSPTLDTSLPSPDIENPSLSPALENSSLSPALENSSPTPDYSNAQPSPPSTNSQLSPPSDDPTSSSTTDMGRGHRPKLPSTRLRDYVTNSVRVSGMDPPSSVPDPSSSSSGTPYPLAHYVNCDKFSSNYRKFLAALISTQEPRSFKEAMKDAGWRASMQSEIQALEDNGTWTLEPLPPGKRALGSQWVYRIKYHSDGSIERLKPRLVVFGNHQQAGLDYNETFALVAKMTTVRAFLAIAASKHWELHQMDVHNAFLHGDLEEEVYMKLPPGFGRTDSALVCRLRKSLYGLKQAPRCWFAKLVTALKGYDFLQSYSDYSLFTYSRGSTQLNVLVYVDDLIISGNDSAAISLFKAYLCDCFKMKDLGPLKYFLGIEVARSASGLFLCQRKYTLDIISEVGLLGGKPCGFPMEQNHRLGHDTGALFDDPERYRRLVGRLIYLAVTRPDLAYSVHILSQFLQAPHVAHWEAALRVVRYLKGTPGHGILLSSASELTLQGWCDSDWAACPLTRRSLSGWLVFLGQSPISWKTKKQHTVSLSSAEAEYRSMTAITCELKWLKGLLLSLGVHHPKAIPLFCDSQSAIHIANNPVFHERTKHIEVDCHFVRDAIQDGLISPSYVPTTAQLADIFTKALGKTQFDLLMSKLGISSLHAPT